MPITSRPKGPASLHIRAGVLALLVPLTWPAPAGAQERVAPPAPQATRPATQPASRDPAGPALLSEYESRWFTNVRQLTSVELGLTRAGEAYFSPDGRLICFQAYPAGADQYQIYIMNVDGSGLRMISTGKGATTCAFYHPDGQRVIFASNHLDPRPVGPPATQATGGKRSYSWSFFPGMDIFEYTLATGQLRQLTDSPGYDAECSYSPDGRHIVFTSTRAGDQDIWICDADGRNPRRVVKEKGYDGGPFYSPDGKRIVYRSDRLGDETMQIFVNNTAGTAERALTDHKTLHWCPYWHPSGKWLIYTRGDHGGGPPKYDLYLISDDGEQALQVTDDPAFDGLPAFSADGQRLMWTSKRGGLSSPQIFIADVVGITPDGTVKAAPGR